MESQNIEFRAVIKFLTKEGAKAKEIHQRMADVYGDSSPKYSTVAKWSAEFKRVQDFLEDKNSAEGVIAPAGAEVTGATIRTWLLNKFISFLAVLTWKTGLKKM